MTTDNLERVENAEETPPTATKTTPKATPSEPAEEPSPEDKTPISRESPDFKAGFAEAQGGGDRRIKLLNTKLSQSQVQAKEVSGKHDALVAEREADTTLSKLLKKYEESGGDPEVVEELGQALRQANKTKAEADKMMKEAVQEKHDIFMANKIHVASKETGLPVEEFDDCDNEYEIIIKVQQHWIDHPKKPEGAKKVDSAMGLGAGVDRSKLSPEQKVTFGLKRFN